MILVVIPAKGGSSRLPGKNMAALNGRPMIDYSIAQARASNLAHRIVVSTDDDAIDRHARGLGVEVVRRPTSLGGDVPILDVYRHALAALNDPHISVIVGLQPDHPDRNVSVDEAIRELREHGADRVMTRQADGTKNGAHYVLSRHFIDTGVSRKDVVLVDDCTNIHYAADLERAAQRLAARGA